MASWERDPLVYRLKIDSGGDSDFVESYVVAHVRRDELIFAIEHRDRFNRGAWALPQMFEAALFPEHRDLIVGIESGDVNGAYALERVSQLFWRYIVASDLGMLWLLNAAPECARFYLRQLLFVPGDRWDERANFAYMVTPDQPRLQACIALAKSGWRYGVSTSPQAEDILRGIAPYAPGTESHA